MLLNATYLNEFKHMHKHDTITCRGIVPVRIRVAKCNAVKRWQKVVDATSQKQRKIDCIGGTPMSSSNSGLYSVIMMMIVVSASNQSECLRRFVSKVGERESQTHYFSNISGTTKPGPSRC